MRKLIHGAFGLASIVAVSGAPIERPASAQSLTAVEIRNSTDFSIGRIYIYRPGMRDLAVNRLERQRLAPSSTALVALDDGCLYGITIETDGLKLSRENLNLCKTTSLIVLGERILTAAEAVERSAEPATAAPSGSIEPGIQSPASSRNPREISVPASADEPISPGPTSAQVQTSGPLDRGRSAGSPEPLPLLVEVHFATNRNRPNASRTTVFGGGRINWLTLGSAKIQVPVRHVLGNLELPSSGWYVGWQSFGISIGREPADPERHFTIRSVVTLNKEVWLSLVSADYSHNEALIFVHGFNTTFEEALYRAAQVKYDLRYPGPVVLFSWPSMGGVLNYPYDRESALLSRDRFIDLLQLLQEQAGIGKINVLAHSMGNFVVVDALSNYARAQNPRKINELIMAAPDVDRDQFMQSVERLARVTEGMTLYASASDRAIAASRGFAGAPRAGDLFEGRPITAPGIDVIDVTVLGAEMLGLNHTVFAQSRPLMNDIRLLLSQRLRPPGQRMLEIVGVPSGAPAFWRFE